MRLVYAVHMDGGQDVLVGGERFSLPTFSEDHASPALAAASLLKLATSQELSSDAVAEELVTIVLWPDDDPSAPVVRTPAEVLDAFARLGDLERAMEGEQATVPKTRPGWRAKR